MSAPLSGVDQGPDVVDLWRIGACGKARTPANALIENICEKFSFTALHHMFSLNSSENSYDHDALYVAYVFYGE
jgi:hypothetical protein